MFEHITEIKIKYTTNNIIILAINIQGYFKVLHKIPIALRMIIFL